MEIRNLLKVDIAPNRVYGLDILRAVAILSVIFLHGCLITPSFLSEKVEKVIPDGVSIFFVLSGFLIGGILIKILEREKPNFTTLLGFWKRRWYRTIPNYYLILIIHTLIAVVFWPGFNVSEIIRSFFFLQNFAWLQPWFFAESWSLSVEEWFYLLIPVLLFLVINIASISSKRAVPVISILIILMVTAFRFGKYIWYIENAPEQLVHREELFGKEVITRLDCLMYGVIAAYISFYFKSLFLRYKVPLLFVGILLFLILKIVPSANNDLFVCVFSYSVISLGTAFTLPFLSDYKTGSGPVYKALTCTSLISYSMYVLHLSFIKWFIIDFCLKDVFLSISDSFSPTAFWISQYTFYWVLTIVLSILLYKYFEHPFMSLRDKKQRKRDCLKSHSFILER
ncbi:MAG: acyltransferase [Candidatus Azobacteroides sp.]|nr:acyltransferase [Candidatus Azobacteroides sp.]